MITLAALPALLLTALPVQNLRDSVRVDPGSASAALGVAASADAGLSAVVYTDAGGAVQVAVSDGRGLAWSAPVRVDADPGGAAKQVQPDAVGVVGDSIYVFWADERSGGRELYSNYSEDRGASWAGERRLDKGYANGVGELTAWNALVTPDPSGLPVYLHVLMKVRPSPGANEEVYYTSSSDGGASYRPTAHPGQNVPVGSADVDAIALDGHDRHVAVIWQDDRSGSNNDVWYQHSHHHGMAWQPADLPIQTNGVGATHAVGPIDVAVEGMTNIVSWTELRSGAEPEVRFNISYDSGANWQAADILIGTYAPGVEPVNAHACHVQNSVLQVAHADRRAGVDGVHVSYSLDGQNWTEEWVAAGAADTLQFRGRESSIGLSWHSAGDAMATFSRNTGLGWQPAVEVSDLAGADSVSIAFDALHDNFLTAWSAPEGGVDHPFASGFRPQTLRTSAPFVAGGAGAFVVEHFSAWESGWEFGVLVSGGLGSYLLPFGDGRETGLLQDAKLAQSLLYIPGAFSGVLDNAGGGATATATIPAGVPPGAVIHAAAVSFQRVPPTGPVLGGLTDTLAVTIQ